MQFLGEFLTRHHARRQLHHRMHRLTHLRVGNADHRDIVHLRVQGETALDFLRVDVDPTGDDGERLAVGQEQVTVIVDVTDVDRRGGIPSRMPSPTGIISLFTLLGTARPGNAPGANLPF